MTKNIYNPMSKEFQDEAKKLGLTGRQLTTKYQKEGLSLEKGQKNESGNSKLDYKNGELLDILRNYPKENDGKIPTRRDFENNPGYPNYSIYRKRFGSWTNALKLVGMDIDSQIKRGNFKTRIQKGRYTEIIIKNRFEELSIDVSGKNCISYYDGICPNGQLYEVKSSSLRDKNGWLYWLFNTRNRDKDENKEAIQWWYFAAFNNDYTKLLYMWRVPGEIIDNSFIIVSENGYRGKFNVANLEKYNITDEFRKIVNLQTESSANDKRICPT